jgi:hypothetical protein
MLILSKGYQRLAYAYSVLVLTTSHAYNGRDSIAPSLFKIEEAHFEYRKRFFTSRST